MKKFVSLIIAAAIAVFASACGKTDAFLPEKPRGGKSNGTAEEKTLAKMSLDEKIGQLFCVSFSGTELSDETAEFLKEYYVGNVILFSKNTENAEQTAKLCKELQSHIRKNTGVSAFIGTDQEGGQVMRVTDGAVYYPGAMALAASGNTENAETIGNYMGSELRSLGINIDFAPVADVNSNPDNPVIGTRSYGDNAEAVSEYAAAFSRGMELAGEISVAKHYPGHGDTAVDSHFGLPSSDKSLDGLMQTELVPFKKLIDGGVPAIMAAHIIYPWLDGKFPASMSKVMLTDILRGKLGFDGIIVTDGMRMGAVADNFGAAKACAEAVKAGADLIITGSGGKAEDLTLAPQKECIKEVKNAVLSGEIPEETLNAAVLRVLKCKEKYKISDCGFKPLSGEVLSAHMEFAKKISADSITLISDGGLLPIKQNEKTLVLSYDKVSRLDEREEEQDKTIADIIAGASGGDTEIIPPLSKLSRLEKNKIFNTYKEKAKKYDKVIVCLSSETHTDVANAVFEANPGTIAVSVGSPYLLRGVKAKTKLCAYEYTENSAEAITDILLGNREPTGNLPVKN